MNLFALLDRGAAYAPSNADLQRAKEVQAAETSRAAWIQALQHDRLRAWMNIGESDAGLLNALVSLMTIAGLAHVHATGRVDLPELNIIRGSISAATQCAQSGCIVTVELARSWDVAIECCIEILQKMPVGSVIHAAVNIRRELGIE